MGFHVHYWLFPKLYASTEEQTHRSHHRITESGSEYYSTNNGNKFKLYEFLYSNETTIYNLLS